MSSKGSKPTSTTTSSKSESTISRSKGNDFYQKFIDSSNYQDQKTYLESAIKFYIEAYDLAIVAGGFADASSAAKNSGTCSMKLIKILAELNARPEIIQRRYTEAIKFFSKACAGGKSSQSKEWNIQVSKLYEQCAQSALNQLKFSELRLDKRIREIEHNIQIMAEDSQKSSFFLEIANLTFQNGIVALAQKDFKGALHAFHECYRPVQECQRFAKVTTAMSQENANYYSKEARVKNDDLIFHLATAESLQAISIGDQLLKEATEDQEFLNMDIIFEVMDWYKKAIIGAREIDVEMEAIALSRLGCLYDKILRIKYKAKEYFLRCMELSMSLFPRDLNSEVWFKNCAEALKRYQAEAARLDEDAKQTAIQVFLDQLKDELTKLKAANKKDTIQLIKFVYKEFPPKNSAHKLDEINLPKTEMDPRIKKILQISILHYHPDKQDVEKYGKKWQALCGEITKCLTMRYENFKLG